MSPIWLDFTFWRLRQALGNAKKSPPAMQSDCLYSVLRVRVLDSFWRCYFHNHISSLSNTWETPSSSIAMYYYFVPSSPVHPLMIVSATTLQRTALSATTTVLLSLAVLPKETTPKTKHAFRAKGQCGIVLRRLEKRNTKRIRAAPGGMFGEHATSLHDTPPQRSLLTLAALQPR